MVKRDLLSDIKYKFYRCTNLFVNYLLLLVFLLVRTVSYNLNSVTKLFLIRTLGNVRFGVVTVN